MKVYLDWVGCRLNQSEIEKIAAQFRAEGHEILPSSQGADLVVVNTCAVTNAAASDSRQKLRQAWRNGAGEVIAAGCWVTMEPEQAQAILGVRHVYNNSEKEILVADILGLSTLNYTWEPAAREPLPGSHKRTRAHIKVQDGCDNFCTYCVTRLLRGKSRSVPYEQVRKDICAAVAGGVREIVLSGVQLGAWGLDFSPQLSLRDLVERVLAETDVPRIRLSSVEPWNLDKDFFSLWKDSRICAHIHLPLQSGCAHTLRRMARPITPQEYSDKLRLAKNASPEIAITTDVIVGFPGEDEEEFNASLEFIQQMDFAGGHVFTYSPRPLTPALQIKGEVPSLEKKRRGQMVRNLFAEKSMAFRRRFLGQELEVLWETVSLLDDKTYRLEGITGNYLRVEAYSEEDLWNQESIVRLHSITKNGLGGAIIKSR